MFVLITVPVGLLLFSNTKAIFFLPKLYHRYAPELEKKIKEYIAQVLSDTAAASANQQGIH